VHCNLATLLYYAFLSGVVLFHVICFSSVVMASELQTSTPVTMQHCENTPKSRASKGPRPMLGSDSSVDNELSYLDLDTGRVLAASRQPEQMSTSAYDAVMTKLMAMEKGLAQLEKLDKLDDIERNVASMNAKLCSLETRLSTNEKLTSELKDSVTVISEQYDSVLETCKQTKTSHNTMKTDIERTQSVN